MYGVCSTTDQDCQQVSMLYDQRIRLPMQNIFSSLLFLGFSDYITRYSMQEFRYLQVLFFEGSPKGPRAWM